MDAGEHQACEEAQACILSSGRKINWPMQVRLWKGLIALRRKMYRADAKMLGIVRHDINFHRRRLKDLRRQTRLLRGQNAGMREALAVMREELRSIQMMMAMNPRPRYCLDV